MDPYRYFKLAAQIATAQDDRRTFRLGAMGLRSDGVVVGASNGPSTQTTPKAHAEARVARKLDKHSTVFVARVTASGDYAMARPCAGCLTQLKSKRVKRVYYTIDQHSYGVIDI